MVCTLRRCEVGRNVQLQTKCRFPSSDKVVAGAAASPSLSQTASLLAAGVIALQATPAMALNMIELQDERQTNKNGLQLIYEVRTGPNPTPPGDPT